MVPWKEPFDMRTQSKLVGALWDAATHDHQPDARRPQKTFQPGGKLGTMPPSTPFAENRTGLGCSFPRRRE
jgi:hypothetical protein